MKKLISLKFIKISKINQQILNCFKFKKIGSLVRKKNHQNNVIITIHLVEH